MESNLPDDYERVMLVKPDVSVYKTGTRPSNRGYRAADWKLTSPDWSGRMRIVSRSEKCIIRLEDKISGQLFGECPIEEWPSVAVEAVLDSSRYFVIRLCDVTGRHAFIGIGFADRGDSFDFNVAIADHFKWLKQSKDLEKQDLNPQPAMDMALKAGQTITINLKNKSGGDRDGDRRGSDSKTRSTGGSFSGVLPPPPSGSGVLPPPPGVRVTNKQELGPLYRAGGTPMPQNVPAPSPVHLKQEPKTGNLIDDDWGAFSSTTSDTPNTDQTNWVSFS